MPGAPQGREDRARSGIEPAEQLPGRKRSPGLRRAILLGVVIVGILGIAAAIETTRLLNDPHVYFLSNEGDAQWIRLDTPFSLNIYPALDTGLLFESTFKTSQTLNYARLTVRAFRRCAVMVDGVTIYVGSTDLDAWQEAHDVPIPGPLPPGTHQLQIAVFNHNAQPCLLAYSEKLGVHTGLGWIAVQPDGKRSPAMLATQTTPPEEALVYPSVARAFVGLSPWLLACFVLTLVWTIWNSRAPMRAMNWPRWHVRPRHVRWVLLAAWIVLAANNIWQLPWLLGYDMDKHLDYVEYIARHRSLPLATDGWQMFQPPLFYLIEAPWYALLSPHFGKEVVIRVLRFVPLLCGLAQIEIVYRAARAVFPEREDLQTIATVVGGLMPMHIYISQVIGNEPLAGSLTSLMVLLCLLLLVEPTRKPRLWFYVLMGVVWGLALLSKVTPLLLAPLVVAAIAIHYRRHGGTWGHGLVRTGLVLGACFLTSGWYFLRNWASLGKPFAAGSWDPATGLIWWQLPSYRTWTQLTSFGTALSRPIYRSVWSLWDALYSSMWLDGFVSGRVVRPEHFPWNLHWMLVGAWLALVPTAFLFASPVTCWRREFRQARSALLFAVAAVAIYLTAMVDLYVRLPVYSTAKATYLIGLLPCFGVLAAAGAAPLLRFRLFRALVFSAIGCWGLASYVAYLDMSWIRRLLGQAH
jgi:hypothetical protein